MIRRRVILAAAVASLVWGSAPTRANAEDRHYCLIFGSQPSPKKLKYSHTWATFVRVVGGGDDPSAYQVFAHTISFVPATLEVRILAAKPEPGINLDLASTLAMARGHQASVTMWGPFLIKPPIYRRSVEVWSIIEDGRAEYRAIDSARNLFISDCIHAVAAVDPQFGRSHYPLIRIGKPASRYISHLLVERSDPDRTHPDASWLLPILGLDRYPIEHIAPSGMPRRGLILGLGRN